MGTEAMRKTKLAIAMALLPFAVNAQMVPAIDPGSPLVTAMNAPSDQARLNDKEQKALEIAREWKNNPNKPRRNADGGVVYLYGSTLPTLICTPLQVCAIHLQAGEEVNTADAGDTRWVIKPSMIGNGPNAITVVLVKPWESGIVTNLIINTNRRSYNIKLMATRHEWVNYVAFDYPDDQARAWENYRARQERTAHASTMPNGLSVLNLDFGFTLGGDNPKWKPIRVYRDENGKTHIEFESEKFLHEAPALVVLGKKKSLWSGQTEQIIPYRTIGNKYLVDGIPDRMALISDVGSNQVVVTIDYTGGKK